MRLDKLSIPNYRNLRNFKIDFDESQPITVLLGRNGTGKSNLIEAVVQIFSDLERDEPPSFAYVLDYVCRGRKVHVDADPARHSKRYDITVDGVSVSYAIFQGKLDSYLPSYVFAYYSGWSPRLERRFDATTRDYYYEVLERKDYTLPLRRLFFCRKDYSQLVLLAFFLDKSEAASDLLKKYLGIEKFESTLFVFKKPWWGDSGVQRKKAAGDGDPNFWYARGAFRGFLKRMWAKALAPIHSDEKVERDIRRSGENTERLYVFIKNQKELEALKEKGELTKTVFGYLESLFLCDLVDEVRVNVVKTDGTRVKFTQLSEGEQQLLTVIGLLLFTQDDESLYLLDEPDTHLNPVWTYDYLSLLHDNIRSAQGQLIVATHNPLMIGSLRKNQVRSLSWSGEKLIAAEPSIDPIGIGIEGLLKSELYGLPSTLGPEVVQKLDRHFLLLGKKDKTEVERAEIMKLARELNALGVARTHPNPYFEKFAQALARRQPIPETLTLSKQYLESQTKLADELLEEVITEERHSKDE